MAEGDGAIYEVFVPDEQNATRLARVLSTSTFFAEKSPLNIVPATIGKPWEIRFFVKKSLEHHLVKEVEKLTAHNATPVSNK